MDGFDCGAIGAVVSAVGMYSLEPAIGRLIRLHGDSGTPTRFQRPMSFSSSEYMRN